MSASPTTPAARRHRPPFWRDVRIIRGALQVGFVVAVGALLWWLYSNMVTNLARQGIPTGFDFLDRRTGFTILGTDFRASQPIHEALWVGLGNTLRVAVLGILLTGLLGIVMGVARLSSNWLVRRVASAYVELFRNIPPLVLFFFFYFAVINALPAISEAASPGNLLVVSNRGMWVPWVAIGSGVGPFAVALLAGVIVAVLVMRWRRRVFDETGRPHHRILWGLGVLVAVGVVAYFVLSPPVTITLPVRDGRSVEGGARLYPELFTVLAALVLYTSAFIAEIVRGSIQAVPRGQTEAAEALGLSWFARLRQVVLPQALRIATPPTGNEYLNLTKNISLGVVIAFAEPLRVARQAIGNGQPAPQLLLIVLIIYLALSAVIALGTNLLNRRYELVER